MLQDIPKILHKSCKSGLSISPRIHTPGLKYSALMNLSGLMTVTNVFIDDSHAERVFFESIVQRYSSQIFGFACDFSGKCLRVMCQLMLSKCMHAMCVCV